jgi:hypothetical protein
MCFDLSPASGRDLVLKEDSMESFAEIESQIQEISGKYFHDIEEKVKSLFPSSRPGFC